MPDGKYAAVDTSGFLPIRAEDIRRWMVDERTATNRRGDAVASRNQGTSGKTILMSVK